MGGVNSKLIPQALLTGPSWFPHRVEQAAHCVWPGTVTVVMMITVACCKPHTRCTVTEPLWNLGTMQEARPPSKRFFKPPHLPTLSTTGTPGVQESWFSTGLNRRKWSYPAMSLFSLPPFCLPHCQAPHSTHPPLPRSTPEHPLPHACDYHTPIHNPLAPTLTHTVINVISFQGLLHGPTIQLRLEAVTGPWPQLKISTAASLAYGMQPTGLALHVVPQVGSCSSRTAAAVD